MMGLNFQRFFIWLIRVLYFYDGFILSKMLIMCMCDWCYVMLIMGTALLYVCSNSLIVYVQNCTNSMFEEKNIHIYLIYYWFIVLYFHVGLILSKMLIIMCMCDILLIVHVQNCTHAMFEEKNILTSLTWDLSLKSYGHHHHHHHHHP